MFKVEDYIARKLSVVCMAHRGFSGRYPENTLLAFQKAIEVGADVIEFDVRSSKDGKLVVIHDSAVDRVSNGTGRVDQLTLEELKKLDLGLRQKIPILEETLDLVAGKIGLNIHIRVKGKQLNRVVELMKEYDIVEEAFIAIEDPQEVLRLRKEYPEIHVCSLYGQTSPNYLELSEKLGVKILQANITGPYLSRKWIEKCHQKGFAVTVFWADTFSDIMYYMKLGVDGILTNFPDNFKEVVKKCSLSETH